MKCLSGGIHGREKRNTKNASDKVPIMKIKRALTLNYNYTHSNNFLLKKKSVYIKGYSPIADCPIGLQDMPWIHRSRPNDSLPVLKSNATTEAKYYPGFVGSHLIHQAKHATIWRKTSGAKANQRVKPRKISCARNDSARNCLHSTLKKS